jgi:hypothetical protein
MVRNIFWIEDSKQVILLNLQLKEINAIQNMLNISNRRVLKLFGSILSEEIKKYCCCCTVWSTWRY